jgi:hypothetical protein
MRIVRRPLVVMTIRRLAAHKRPVPACSHLCLSGFKPTRPNLDSGLFALLPPAPASPRRLLLIPSFALVRPRHPPHRTSPFSTMHAVPTLAILPSVCGWVLWCVCVCVCVLVYALGLVCTCCCMLM